MLEKSILEQITKEFNLNKKQINIIYQDWIRYIEDKIRNTDYNECKELLGFTIPYVGKLYVNKNKLFYINKNKENKNGRTECKENTAKS